MDMALAMTASRCTALSSLRAIWPDRPMLVIGAEAVVHRLGVRHRDTGDIDIAASAEWTDLADLTTRLGYARFAGEGEPRFRAPDGLVVGVLPCSPAACAEGVLRFPSGKVLLITAMDLAFEHNDDVEVTPGAVYGVPDPAVLVLLKMQGYIDNSRRQRDLADIGFLIEDDPAGLGATIGCMAAPRHRRLVDQFLLRVPRDLLGRLGPPAFRSDHRAVGRALSAFERGYRAAVGSEVTARAR
jgi:hypothetical protein